MTLTKALLLEDEKQIDWVRHYFLGVWLNCGRVQKYGNSID
jgi:hypothetical protein